MARASRAETVPVKVQVLPRQPSRWQEWLIMVLVLAIAAIGVVTVLGRDVQHWWKPGDSSPGNDQGPGRKGGPGSKPPTGPTGPTGPSGPAIPI